MEAARDETGASSAKRSFELLVILEERISLSHITAAMPPRLNVSAFSRSIAFRPKPQVQWPARSALRVAPSQARTYADAPPYADQNAPAQDRSHKPSSEPIEHVSEEAAKTAQIMGQQGPDVNQGTPVEDVSVRKKIDG